MLLISTVVMQYHRSSPLVPWQPKHRFEMWGVCLAPYGFVDKITKLVPADPGMTLEKAFDVEPRLVEMYEQDDDVREIIDMARILEGVTRNAGKHAGGVVIAPNRITDFSPLYCDEDGQHPVTQFDKNDVE